MSLIRISESIELNINYGVIEVDTSKSGVTIFMKPIPIHKQGETLTIRKISNDNHTISLFSDSALINGAEIIIFGLPKTSRFSKGKIQTIVLKSFGNHYRIVTEQ